MKSWPKQVCMTVKETKSVRIQEARGKVSWMCQGNWVCISINVENTLPDTGYHVIFLARMNKKETVGIVCTDVVTSDNRGGIQVQTDTVPSDIFGTGISLNHIAGVTLAPVEDSDFSRAITGYCRASFEWQQGLQIVHVTPREETKGEGAPKDHLESCKRLMEERGAYAPFHPPLSDAKWVKITLEDYFRLKGIYRNKALDEVVLASYQEYQYLILGFVENKNLHQCIIGIPYNYNLDHQLQMADLGFSRFMCSDTRRILRDGERGYWLYMF